MCHEFSDATGMHLLGFVFRAVDWVVGDEGKSVLLDSLDKRKAVFFYFFLGVLMGIIGFASHGSISIHRGVFFNGRVYE
jgi:hypothetical protein